MRLYKGFLHFLITLASTAAFLGGWAALAHSLKPVQPVQKQESFSLAPLPPVGQVNTNAPSGRLQIFSPAPGQNFSRPTFVTRGS